MADKEYIERGAVLALSYCPTQLTTDNPLIEQKEVVDVDDIMQIPNADVVEVRRGEWNYDGSCNRCKKQILSNYMNFCPNCGADMRGNKDDSRKEN